MVINPIQLFVLRLLALIIPTIILFSSCNKSGKEIVPVIELTEIKACDLSFLPEIRNSGVILKNQDGKPEDMLITLQNAGMNTVRLRLWNNPADGHSGFNEVKALSQEIKNLGLHVWLTVHYSDSWADPGSQTKPENWKNLPFKQLEDSVYAFTKKIVTEINPDVIQIGNEINHGFLWPDGNISNKAQLIALLHQGVKAVRDHSAKTKIMIHYAGYKKATEFYSQLSGLDYDLIGLSYYPFWHGKDLDSLQTGLDAIGATLNKQVLIAETSYPFTFEWNDWTNNVIGLQSQILNDYPATETGQRDFLQKIREITKKSPKGFGFAYWGGEWISFKGNTASNGSSWENQAFWDFDNKVLPVIQVFNE
ncbi:MAG: cellulase family glycosylhydrolase [Bacteroidales bacterium]|nr:cellulase family glycosylhydrolase [Bacteroidales bacterium]